MSEPREKWEELCEQVVAERDSKRLTEPVAMLDNELEHREAATKTVSGQQSPSSQEGRAKA